MPQANQEGFLEEMTLESEFPRQKKEGHTSLGSSPVFPFQDLTSYLAKGPYCYSRRDIKMVNFHFNENCILKNLRSCYLLVS